MNWTNVNIFRMIDAVILIMSIGENQESGNFVDHGLNRSEDCFGFSAEDSS